MTPLMANMLLPMQLILHHKLILAYSHAPPLCTYTYTSHYYDTATIVANTIRYANFVCGRKNKWGVVLTPITLIFTLE